MPIRLGGALLVEFIGTFAFCLTAVLARHHPEGSEVITAAASGLILAGMISAAAYTSGGHFNPALTLGLLVAGRIKPVAAISYWVIQILAGVVACLAVYVMFGGGQSAAAVVLAGAPRVGREVTPAGALLAETLLAFLWVFTYCATVADPRAARIGGLAVGAALAAGVIALAPLTGGAANPARALGPTLIGWTSAEGAGVWRHHWVYWLGPALGGCMAALVHSLALSAARGERGGTSA